MKTVHLVVMTILSLALGIGGASALQVSYPLVVDMLSKDGEVRRRAGERLVASGDKTLLAALNDALAFCFVIQDPDRVDGIAKVMQRIAHQEIRENPKLGWMKWVGRHKEIEPKPGYLDFKRAVFAFYDPAFRQFLDPGFTFRIRPEEIEWGGVKKDGIPTLQNPAVIRAKDAKYLGSKDLVFGVYLDGVARAYPHRILDWHEMTNDVVGDTPISLSYCTLCGSGIVYDGRVEMKQYTFGSSGLLYRSNKLMYDNQTKSLWSNLTGEPVSGKLVDSGIKLKMLPVVVTTWKEWVKMHPDTEVLDPETGYELDYANPPYEEYFSSDDTMFPVWLEDDRLEKKDWVFALIVNDKPKAYPLKDLKKERVVHDQLGGKEIVLVVEKSSGAVRAYESDGRRFKRGDDDGQVIEQGSGSAWRITEESLNDPSGKHQLARLPGHNAFWFGWYAFYSETELYERR